MAGRIGLGPVFEYEWLTTSRRWQVYAARSAFVAILLVGLWSMWRSAVEWQAQVSFQGQAYVGRQFFTTIVAIEVTLVLLAAPAATAGSICLDKARGSLAHLMATDLSDAEIVLGKLAARLATVLGLVACALPVMAIGTLLGGVDPMGLAGSFLATASIAVLACTLALMLSVWGRKTHEVLMTTYLVLIAWVLASPVFEMISFQFRLGWWSPMWLQKLNPYFITIAPATQPMQVGLGDQVVFAALMLVVSAVMAAVATARVRRVALSQAGGPAPPRRRGSFPRLSSIPPFRWVAAAMARARGALPGPAMDPNPVLWREWHRNRPSRWTRFIWGTYGAGSVGFSLFAIAGSLDGQRPTQDLAAVINGFQASVGLLLLSVLAATSLAEERVRGSLDVLLSTPMPTSAILWGKWWGSLRRVGMLAILPGLVAAALAPVHDHWVGPPLVVLIILAYGAALTSLGLALAVWVPRLGRAVALTVTGYVAMTVGFIPLVLMLFRRNDHVGMGMAIGSPFWGVGFFSAMIAGTGGPFDRWSSVVAWEIGWIVAYSVVAGLLLLATLKTFNRCLGRMDDRPAPADETAKKPPRNPFAEEADLAPVAR